MRQGTLSTRKDRDRERKGDPVKERKGRWEGRKKEERERPFL